MIELPTPTGRELDILKVLWQHGPCSVRTVYRHLAEAQEEDLAYNTVQTLLRIMEEKSLARHHLDGRTFIYTARFTRDDSTARFLDRVFDGAAAQLVQSLLRSERVSAEELDRMQALPNGHLLVALYTQNKVAEFDADGREVWQAAQRRPSSAYRLPNGHTLVATRLSRVVSELDRKGQVVATLSVGGRVLCISRR